MTYTTGNLIEATDFNNIVGATNSTTANTFNAVWGVGSGDAGYGQSNTIPTVAVGNTVTATQWSTLLTRINTARSHQGGAAFGMTSPVAGNTISVIANLITNVNTLYTNRLNASAVAAASAATDVSRTTAWAGAAGPQTITHTFTVTFASGDEARYFFNCGGYIEIDPSVLNYGDNRKEQSWANMIAMFGQFRLSAQTSGLVNETTTSTITVTDTSNDVADSAVGYHDLTTSNQLVVTKTLTTASSPYLSPSANNITVNVRSNGAQGSNGDKGSVITIVVAYNDTSTDDNYAGAGGTTANSQDVITGTLTSSLRFYEPSTTNLTKTWGTPTVSGAAS